MPRTIAAGGEPREAAQIPLIAAGGGVHAPEAAGRAEIELDVEVAAVRFRAPDGDFAVVEADAGGPAPIVMTGPLAYLHTGEELGVIGRWREHPRHGMRFEVGHTRHREPTSETGVLAALLAIKHVGERGAAFLFGRYGAEALRVLDAEPERRLREVPGIGRARLAAAARSWEAQRAQRALRMFLAEHGVPAPVASRIFRAWGERSVERLRRDPYGVAGLPGVGFQSADALARAMGIPWDAPQRIDASLTYALERAELDGHCFLPRAELAQRAMRLLAYRPPRAGTEDPIGEGDDDLTDVDACEVGERVGERVDALCAQGGLVREDGSLAVYGAEMRAAEERLGASVGELAAAEPVLARIDAVLPTAMGFAPTAEQWGAVVLALEHRLSILTGGPGTGKTTSMRALVDLLRCNGASV
ncbi:MAG: AAA family ATPase, partial [Acidobacteriota bacterium]|nr:AAA family ATPase [Acidobacteriota bacterium]